ncbi:MAG: transcription-repair coupling factor [Candidatus Saganbacteria bacterium]|nr:transcription-repair coupling factor [Candidatus Saganbacteria bacterium]
MQLPQLEDILDQLKPENKRIIINHLPAAAKAAYLSEIVKETKKPLLVITSNTQEAEILSQQLALSNVEGLSTDLFPSPDTVPGEEFDPEKEIVAKRIQVLNNIPNLITAPLKAVMWKTVAKLKIKNEKLSRSAGSRNNNINIAEAGKINVGEILEIEGLKSKLVEFGYKRQEIVGERGEFAVRGGIVDIFFYEPVRIEFFGDKIESIRVFDAQSQRSIRKLESFDILPIVEKGDSSFLDHLSPETIIFFDEPMQLKIVAERLLDEEVEIQKRTDSKRHEGYFSFDEIKRFLEKFQVIINTAFEEGIKIDTAKLPVFPKIPSLPKKTKAVKEGVNRALLLELKDGAFVVHENYGIGIYRGMQKMEIDGAEQEYLLLEYAANDRLYVPLQQMGLIEKYSGDPNPRVYRLHGKEWSKTRSKVKKSLQDLTKDLLFLYAIRSKTEGHAYPSDLQWQNELRASFPYEETPDQQRAIDSVMRDMESSRPMDRLICGDVGYGKTEVALRAAFRAATAGKQVALLAPTTILVLQHFTTFYDRLKNYPIKIEMLSRFKSKEEQKEIVSRVQTGEVDIVIGTHRLLQKDMCFKELGLLIVDEEQRFGVGHKERLKQLKKNIDVITLTATPIPRTLYFSLSGARDMSLINTAPVDRLSIRTHVVPWDSALIKEVIARELDRGGQVYFVHNFVRTIETVASKIKKLVPHAKVIIGHGQMREDKLAQVMTDFQEKKFDVLVCTTIIESGLDIPNVNTMIIDHAERFGLAQLYQLRGRIGRSSSRAYAYLLYHKEDVLTSVALERLKAIQEFKELGSGYRLAMRDLEIRGSGTLLGAKQSGHIVSVGFDMYCDLLEEAVNKAKGVEVSSPRQVIVDLVVSSYIPSDYISDERQRIATYRRLTILQDQKQLNEIRDELKDRYGRIPKPLQYLLEVVDLKIKAQKAGIKQIKEQKGKILVEWFNGRHKYLRGADLAPSSKIKGIQKRLSL